MTGLNIKDAEVHALARRIADRTGQSMTGAIRAALRDLDRRLDAAGARADAEALLALARQVSGQVSGPPPDHGTDLYDAQGLPR